MSKTKELLDATTTADQAEIEADNIEDDTENAFRSYFPKFPVDINISKAQPLIDTDSLKWSNFDIPPKNMKITNNGHTIIITGKWTPDQRPSIKNEQILNGNSYNFSQLHIHWGRNDMEGSEHTIDGGCHLPGEIHMVTFKNAYSSHESALKETDGIVIVCYFLKLQNLDNPGFSLLICNQLAEITNAYESKKIKPPIELIKIIRPFDTDFFMYRGLISTSDCSHHIQWVISRYPIGVSAEQMDSLRFLLDDNGTIITRNFRVIDDFQEKKQHDDKEQEEMVDVEIEKVPKIVTIYHVLPSTSKYSTLLPMPEND